jgi:Caspase domain
MRVVFVLLVLSLIVAAPQAYAGSSSGSRVALVIGNASYPNADPPLTQPIGNARALGEELMRDGFQVDVGENLTKEVMQRAFGRLYDRIKPGTVALIFFSGYGIQSNRQSYMIPVVAAVAGSNWDAIPATFKLIAHTLMNLALTAGILHSVTRCPICPKIPPAPHGISTPNIARGNCHATRGPQYPVAKVPRCLVSAAPINTPFSRKMLCAEPQAS